MSNIVPIQAKQLIGAEEIKVLKDSLFKNFTDAEVNYSMAICNNLQLNPLLKQIHFVKRRNKDGSFTIAAQTGIDGFRLAAQRAGGYAGSDDAIFEFGADKKPIKATVTVYKMVDGQRCPFTGTARWDEYLPSPPNDTMWRKMPTTMLAKCAEALALRKAFPAELSALRSDEEMQQADGPSKAAQVQARIIQEQKDIETTATQVSEPSEPEEPEEEAEQTPNCSLCGAEMKVSRSGASWYCPNFNDKKGDHPKVPR